MKTFLLALICVAGLQLAACDQTSDQTPPAEPQAATQPSTQERLPATTQPNDTGVNVRDRSSAAVTPGEQAEDQADIQLLANIRKRVMTANLSVTAQNVKIITNNGLVTLRGPVTSQTEKDTIARIAADLAGPDHVTNELQVENNLNNQ
jgi:hyperosmotically inducible periplasmic protein